MALTPIGHYSGQPRGWKGWVPGKMGKGAGLERQLVAWPLRALPMGAGSLCPQQLTYFRRNLLLSVFSCMNKQQTGEQEKIPCGQGFGGGPSQPNRSSEKRGL